MPLNRNEIIAVLQQVSELKALQVTVTESVKGACTIGLFALGGSLLGGPIGIGIGGIVGSLYTAMNSRGKYKSVAEVILCDMSAQQQSLLAEAVEDIIRGIDAQDVVTVVGLIMGSSSLQSLVVAQMAKCLQKEMGLTLL